MQSGQLNVRMSESLRIEGNLALEAAGWTPSQAVRALWQFAAAHRNRPSEISDLLDKLKDVQSPEKAARLALAAEGAQIVEKGMREMGVDIIHPAPQSLLPYKELRDIVYDELVQEKCQ